MIHRDIKPDNIMLSSGEAVVADFGIARAVGVAGAEHLTGTGAVLGTPAYMSPEQCEGAGDIDGRTDVYALGTLLYHLLTGEPPYTGSSPIAIIAKRMSEPVPSVSTLRETVPAAVEAAITKALAKTPADRFATASEFSDALRRASRTGATPARSGVGPKAPMAWQRTAVATGAMAALAVGTWAALNVLASGVGDIDRLAVLPLTNVMADDEQDYFVVGMQEALIAELGRIGGVDVISRQSVARYQETDQSLQQIGRELRVDALITGSVLRVEDDVRIQAGLIEVEPRERRLWSETYDEDVRNVLALHSQVARAIAVEIKNTLTPTEEQRLSSILPVNPGAYDAYLRGRFFWSRRDPPSLQRAIEYFEEALVLDPGYAVAYVGLADAYLALAINGFDTPGENLERAIDGALNALRLDGELAEAHAAIGWARMNTWEWAAAEESLRRAIDLNQSYPSAHQWYGQLLVYSGRIEQGLAELRRALELDPFGFPATAALGISLYYSHNYDEAIEVLAAAAELSPTFPLVYGYLAGAYAASGMPAEGIASLEDGFELLGRNPFLLVGLATVHAASGATDELEQVLDELMETTQGGTTPLSRSSLATVHALRGDYDTAMDWLERAYEEGEPRMSHIKVQPTLDALQQNPRFQDLLRRIGLPN